MKNFLLTILVFTITQSLFAQDTPDTVSDSISNNDNYTAQTEYNKWSFEIGVGGNKPIEPFTKGYSGSDESDYLNAGKPDHFEAGVRYMFNTKFGLKLDGAYDKITNSEGSSSLPFEATSMRVNLQGVVNIGRALNFEDFTSRFGLLAHAGVQASIFTPKSGPYTNIEEHNGGFIFGLTPQFRISRRFVFHADLSMISNLRHHYTWDGQTNEYFNANVDEKNLNGRMFSSSVGLTVYLGKQDQHADWFVNENTGSIAGPAEMPEIDLSGITARLDELENCLLDSDKDGVNNCIDEEENSAPGAYVNTKGVTIEKPKDGQDGKDGIDGKTVKQNVITEIRKGSLLNVFYDVNKDEPNAASAGDVSLIIGYMVANPESKIRLIGYADTRGGAEKNKALSMRRAKNLTKQIVAKGINSDRVRFDGFGVDKRSANMSKEEMDYARRTEVIVE